MRISVARKPIKIYPDSKRVIVRFFYNGDERAVNVIKLVMCMSDAEVKDELVSVLREFSKRHRRITRVFERNCERISNLFESLDISLADMDHYRKMLIGSYFTHEYSIESAAFFNPSIVENPDQSDLPEGKKELSLVFVQ